MSQVLATARVIDYDPEVMRVLREAFTALHGSHPEVMAKIADVIEAARGHESPIPIVEAAFRDAGKALLPTDRDAAQTLFRVAETLAEISTYWGVPGD